jgi:hypothetical protein
MGGQPLELGGKIGYMVSFCIHEVTRSRESPAAAAVSDDYRTQEREYRIKK